MIFNDPYKDDYDHRPVKDKKGRFHDEFYYKGELHELPMDETQKKKASCIHILMAVLLIGTAVLPGLMDHPGSYVLWVTLPYVCCFLPAAYFLLGAIEFATNGRALTRREYDHSVRRMDRSVTGLIVLSVMNLIIAAVYLIMSGETGEIPYILSFLPLAGISLLRILVQRKEWRLKADPD